MVSRCAERTSFGASALRVLPERGSVTAAAIGMVRTRRVQCEALGQDFPAPLQRPRHKPWRDILNDPLKSPLRLANQGGTEACCRASLWRGVMCPGAAPSLRRGSPVPL